jgi:hypothetical protein
MEGYILIDMTVVSNEPIRFVTLDCWHQIIEKVNILPAKSALKATNNAGMISIT